MSLTKDQMFLSPFLGYFLLVAFLYAWLTYERQVAVFKKEVKVADFVNAGADPLRSKRIARNLANQFELPVFALFAALILYMSGKVEIISICAAWLFLTGRLIHTLVQTLSNNIPLRGIVFMINFIAVMVLMTRVALMVFA